MPYQENDVFFNTKVKTYPDGNFHITYCTDKIFKDKTIEKAVDIDKGLRISLSDEMKDAKRLCKHNEDEQISRVDNVLRSKRKVFDIVYINDFKYFVTLTFDLEKVDSYDHLKVYKAVRQFVDNRVRNHNFKYVLIPEYHKLKVGEISAKLHLHGFFNEPEKGLTFIDSGHKSKSGKTIYNIPEWQTRNGWTTACKLDGDIVNCAKYITKYVTKDSQRIFGSYYLAGGVNREVPQILANTNFDEVKGKKINVHIGEWNRSFAYEDSFRPVDDCYYLGEFDCAVNGIS